MLSLLQINRNSSPFSQVREISKTRFTIYQAYHDQLEEEVVLKLFPSDNYSYHNEKSLLQSLDHPHLVRLIQAVDVAPAPCALPSDEPFSCLVLEYAPFGDFSDVVRQCKRLPEKIARTFFCQLIKAVEYLHLCNMAHLDLKLQNILLDKEFRLRVADFDMSQALDSTELKASGTPGYRAPEIAKKTCTDFCAADMFSIGVILFAMVAGTNPYEEDTLTNWRLYNGLKKKPDMFWDMHQRWIGDDYEFSSDFKELIQSLMAENPKDRPSIEEVKKSTWFNGEVVEEDSYFEEMKKFIQSECKGFFANE